MLRYTRQPGLLLAFALPLLYAPFSHAYQAELSGYFETRAEYNDNIFLTTLPHDDIYGLTLIPAVEGSVSGENWGSSLQARLQDYNYSDSSLNSTDSYLNLDGNYLQERNQYSLAVKHDRFTNLRTDSSDFGAIGRLVEQQRQSVTPTYTRFLTERLSLSLSYSYTDVDFIDSTGTGSIPYVSQLASAYMQYNLTETTDLSLSIAGIDYVSENDRVEYRLLLSRIGIAHKFTETFSVDALVGVSRRSATNRITQTFDFFGNPVVQSVEIESRDRGLLLDFGLEKEFESATIESRLSRDNTTNSFGGLDRIDRFSIYYFRDISKKSRYRTRFWLEDITSLSSGTRDTERNILYGEFAYFHKLTELWEASASYRYVQRKFKSNSSPDRAPHSNRIYIGITYNFPSLSTF